MVSFQFESDAEVINSLEVEFRSDERIMRFLTVKLDIHALEWADKRKKRNISYEKTTITFIFYPKYCICVACYPFTNICLKIHLGIHQIACHFHI